MTGDSERSSATPSTDPVNPEANRWLPSSVQERLNATVNPGSTRATSRTAQAAFLQGLAARLGRDAEDLAATIPPDTVRRLKYPVLAHENPDGSTTYVHDLGISEGAMSDRSKDVIVDAERRFDAAARDAKGRFSK